MNEITRTHTSTVLSKFVLIGEKKKVDVLPIRVDRVYKSFAICFFFFNSFSFFFPFFFLNFIFISFAFIVVRRGEHHGG